MRFALSILLFSACLKVVPAHSLVAAHPAQNGELNGMVNPGHCSGAMVRLGENPGKVYVLTNGHCWSRLLNQGLSTGNGRIVHYNLQLANPQNSFVTAFDVNNGQQKVQVSRLVYATMDRTDIALFETVETEAALTARRIRVFRLSQSGAQPGDVARITSAYWNSSQTCLIERVVPTLQEGYWTFNDAFALDHDCYAKGGWSGSPVISAKTGEIIAILNTLNENGMACTMNNPCEVSAQGQTYFQKGNVYAQRTSDIHGCVTADGEFDLALPTCSLPKP